MTTTFVADNESRTVQTTYPCGVVGASYSVVSNGVTVAVHRLLDNQETHIKKCKNCSNKGLNRKDQA